MSTKWNILTDEDTVRNYIFKKYAAEGTASTPALAEANFVTNQGRTPADASKVLLAYRNLRSEFKDMPFPPNTMDKQRVAATAIAQKTKLPFRFVALWVNLAASLTPSDAGAYSWLSGEPNLAKKTMMAVQDATTEALTTATQSIGTALGKGIGAYSAQVPWYATPPFIAAAAIIGLVAAKKAGVL